MYEIFMINLKKNKENFPLCLIGLHGPLGGCESRGRFQTRIPVFRPVGVTNNVWIYSVVQANDDALVPVKGAISMQSLRVVFNHETLTVGKAYMQIVAVLVVMQKVTFAGFYHNAAWMILSSENIQILGIILIS